MSIQKKPEDYLNIYGGLIDVTWKLKLISKSVLEDAFTIAWRKFML